MKQYELISAQTLLGGYFISVLDDLSHFMRIDVLFGRFFLK